MFEVALQKQSLSVIVNHLKSDFSYRKLSSRKRGNWLSVYHRISLKYRNDQRGQTRLQLTSFCLKLCGEKHRITRLAHYNAKLQTSTRNIRATKYSVESTYSDLPCNLKVKRGKFAMINCPWKCKKGKDRWSLLVLSQKPAEHDNFTQDLNPRLPVFKSRTLNTQPHCLLIQLPCVGVIFCIDLLRFFLYFSDFKSRQIICQQMRNISA